MSTVSETDVKIFLALANPDKARTSEEVVKNSIRSSQANGPSHLQAHSVENNSGLPPSVEETSFKIHHHPPPQQPAPTPPRIPETIDEDQDDDLPPDVRNAMQMLENGEIDPNEDSDLSEDYEDDDFDEDVDVGATTPQETVPQNPYRLPASANENAFVPSVRPILPTPNPPHTLPISAPRATPRYQFPRNISSPNASVKSGFQNRVQSQMRQYGEVENQPRQCEDNYITRLPQQRQATKEEEEEILLEKQSVLLELERLKGQGILLSKNYTIHDRIEDMQFEVRRHLLNIEEQNTIQFMRDGMRLAFTGIEILNGKLGPFLELDGWASEISTDITKYDSALSRMYRKYWKRSAMSPEMEITVGVLGSMGMHHFKKKFMSKMMGGIGGMGSGPMGGLGGAMGGAMGGGNGIPKFRKPNSNHRRPQPSRMESSDEEGLPESFN